MYFFARFNQINLTNNLKVNGFLYVAERVHVFHLDFRPKFGRAFLANGDVQIRTKRTFFHVSIRNF